MALYCITYALAQNVRLIAPSHCGISLKLVLR
jgi:hypothetical protein